jgi:hypothetical protein
MMKVFIIYDETGEIRGTATSHLQDFRIGVDPALSYFEEDHDIEDTQITQYLRNLHETYSVDVTSSGQPRLIVRSS